MNVALDQITAFLNETVRIDKVTDFPGAWNGLQLANDGSVNRVAAAVDASLNTVKRASAESGTLLIVHHGLFWGEIRPITGASYGRFHAALTANLAVYSAHLPLDLHPELGNNAIFARKLGIPVIGTFFREFDCDIGLVADGSMGLDELVGRVERVTSNKATVLRCGEPWVRRIGIVTGGAGSGLRKAVDAGVDTLITGEGPHHTFGLAQDLGMNVVYGGHYATEVFGVQALARLVSERFGIPWSFIDDPSGL